MTRHLYIHIPFCHKICPYCSFYKHQPGNTSIDAFIAALLSELSQHKERFPLQLETIYCGGGTPSLLSRAHLHLFLSKLTRLLDLSHLKEWTFEVNPSTIKKEKAQLLYDFGINRISLGVQSWTPSLLEVLGRDHSPQTALSTVDTFRSIGFENINIDLMFSIPGQTHKQWKHSLEQTLSLQPQHIAAYNLTYEEDTEFFHKLNQGKFLQDDTKDADFFTLAKERLTSAGYQHYEISNYAQPGFSSYHNQGYWEGRDYLGIGPSAVSTVNGKRWKNISPTQIYIDTIKRQDNLHTEVETIDAKKFRSERIALLLRTHQGVEKSLVGTSSKLEDFLREGYIAVSPSHIILTSKGKLVADTIAEELI